MTKKKEQEQLLFVVKETCDFCDEPGYFYTFAREASSGEMLLVCEKCAIEFGGDFKDVKNK